MRVLVLNNYSLQNSLYAWKHGMAGRHHLWGASELSRYGHQVEYLTYRRWPWLNRITGNSWRWGDVDQESRALLAQGYDVIYAAASGVIMGLAFLRGLHAFRKPIVGLVHQHIPGGRYSRICLRGMDGIACLNSSVATRLRALFPEVCSRITVAEWGWDLQFAKPSVELGNYLFSVGMSVRDYDTLWQALGRVALPAKIVCPEGCVPKLPLPQKVDIRVVTPGRNWISESDLRPCYQAALAVAVPLKREALSVTSGISSVLEAMANGKAVLATRTPCLDVDIEAEGCGIYVEPGDVAGWVRALRYIMDNPQAAREMGARGRRLCEQRYSIERFGDRMVRLIEQAAQPRQAAPTSVPRSAQGNN